MSKIGNYLLDLQEIIDPMVYQGFGDKTIIACVKDHYPDATDPSIMAVISRARFDYGSFDSYA